jgi:hypothetical protein
MNIRVLKSFLLIFCSNNILLSFMAFKVLLWSENRLVAKKMERDLQRSILFKIQFQMHSNVKRQQQGKLRTFFSFSFVVWFQSITTSNKQMKSLRLRTCHNINPFNWRHFNIFSCCIGFLLYVIIFLISAQTQQNETYLVFTLFHFLAILIPQEQQQPNKRRWYYKNNKCFSCICKTYATVFK